MKEVILYRQIYIHYQTDTLWNSMNTQSVYNTMCMLNILVICEHSVSEVVAVGLYF